MTISATRFDGSEHYNVFTGTLEVYEGNDEITPSGEFPAGTTFPGAFLVKFGPLDMPLHVFDDVGTPPGTSGQTDAMGPHASYPDKSWVKNTNVVAIAEDPNTYAIALDATPWETDSTTGKPVLRLLIGAVETGGVVTIQVTVKHTATR